MKTTAHPASNGAHAGMAGPARAGQRGYALLGLLLALSVISIYLVSSVVPNVKMSVQRSKEEELIYRGNQMAKAIARYYGGRALRPLQLQVPPPYGYLTELKKLRDGVTLGVQEVRFARTTEMIDPMTGVEWEPVRARDPRINRVLQAYAAETGAIIPQSYLLLAGPPPKIQRIKGLGSDSGAGTTGEPGTQPGQPGVTPPNGVAVVRPPGNHSEDLDDDDDDDDDDANDPLGHLFKSDSFSSSSAPGKSTVPIIGVAPKLKGKGVRTLYGLEYYEEWVFIYVPPAGQGFGQGSPGVQPVQPNQPGQPGGGGLKTSP
jgi:hypothetical protein